MNNHTACIHCFTQAEAPPPASTEPTKGDLGKTLPILGAVAILIVFVNEVQSTPPYPFLCRRPACALARVAASSSCSRYRDGLAAAFLP